MSALTKTFLAFAVGNLLASVPILSDLVDVSNAPGLYVTFPVGVTCSGLFLLSWVLQKEVAAFDSEQRSRHQPASPRDSSRSKDSTQSPDDHVSVGV